MTSLNLISHDVCKTRKFVMAILHWKQGLICDKMLAYPMMKIVICYIRFISFLFFFDTPCFTDCISGYSFGAPWQVCLIMFPKHKLPPHVTDCPFVMTANQTEYMPGDTITGNSTQSILILSFGVIDLFCKECRDQPAHTCCMILLRTFCCFTINFGQRNPHPMSLI